jgi:hypothetical protein
VTCQLCQLLVVATVAALASAASGCGSDNAAPGDDSGGCMPIDSPTTCPANPPSYQNEIRFVVASNCAQAKCHAPGGAVSVHNFTTYDGVVADRLTVAFRVSMCAMPMPPAGYPQLTTAQRLDLITWAGICKAPNN